MHVKDPVRGQGRFLQSGSGYESGKPPAIKWPGWSSTATNTYALLMLDPDLSYACQSSTTYYVHWCVELKITSADGNAEITKTAKGGHYRPPYTAQKRNTPLPVSSVPGRRWNWRECYNTRYTNNKFRRNATCPHVSKRFKSDFSV
ncbi:uncharacterized protein LOC112562066 [Pomacea canaliculata]|uniref:uncharacterized protein LOC112562066 n=1 Tax=Pomacea canaliculata TaxID=400727 RepID=UPI000D72F6F7|nr:uncharacterized protein LOC112562066 [Pomacea canaliculata]